MKKAGDIATEASTDLLAGIDPGMKAKLVGIQQRIDKRVAMAKRQGAEQKRIDDAHSRVKAQVVKLPVWPEPQRGVPNSVLRGALFAAIQGKDRRALKGELLAVQEGIQIRFTGWQLDQSDLDVWEQALHLARLHPLGTKCTFTAHTFLKALGRATGKANHEWLKDVFRRLAGAVVEITHNGMTYGGSMLEFYREECSQLYGIEINPKIRSLYTAGWSTTDWEQRKLLKRKPLALWLHGFYATHAKPFPYKAETLMQLSGSSNKTRRSYIIKLKKAHEDLKAIGAINSYQIDGDLVSVKRIPSKSQHKHLRKPKLRER